MFVATTREISHGILSCQLTHLTQTLVGADLTKTHDAEYKLLLVQAGCTIRKLDTASGMADSVFVEDIAAVFDKLTLITRSGAETRRAKTLRVMDALIRLQGFHYGPRLGRLCSNAASALCACAWCLAELSGLPSYVLIHDLACTSPIRVTIAICTA